ncbi:unnamed protein product [Adineta ricciae]|uniref:C2 domain-containing protein n=1 Tax=Adineta ricciae TaxID=249248 RepID=A0A813V4G8_ADIRI|nr:unnamed protein product [Adineta ricciae]
MSSHSLADGLKSVVPEITLLINTAPPDAFDVVIQFLSAENLPKMDPIGRGDPYFIAKIDDHITYTSSILPNTSSPKWENEEWIVRNIPATARLSVTVFDKDDDEPMDDYIGQFEILNVTNYHPPPSGHDILSLTGSKHGQFHLSIQSIQSSDETKHLPRYTFDGPCRYFRHDSFVVGRLTMLNADSVYSTWKIPMRRISVFFPPYQKQHWNKHYKAAQLIFGKCPASLLSKTTLKVTHKALYARTVKHSENGRLNSADDLWKYVFAHKTTKQIKPCIYTYIIDNYTWRFSETGRQFFADFASKHALLANGSEYVRYAGEFHVRPTKGWDHWNAYDTSNDSWEIVIDNGSGTYTPSSDLLKNLKELFLFNFPGLNIVTYDFKDPKLKESEEQLKAAIENYKDSSATIEELASPPVIIERL